MSEPKNDKHTSTAGEPRGLGSHTAKQGTEIDRRPGRRGIA